MAKRRLSQTASATGHGNRDCKPGMVATGIAGANVNLIKPLDPQVRRQLRLNWLSSIEEIANYEKQRLLWLNQQQQNRHHTFIEYRESYLSDLALSESEGGYVRAVAVGFVTPAEANVLAEFHGLFRAYKPPNKNFYDHEAILRDPAWLVVVQAALSAKTQLAGLLTDEQEIAVLLGNTGNSN